MVSPEKIKNSVSLCIDSDLSDSTERLVIVVTKAPFYWATLG